MEIRGKIILVRLKNSGEITSDTTLTSICDRYGIKYDKVRTKKYPFWFEHNGESFHFQRMRVREDVQNDDFRPFIRIEKDVDIPDDTEPKKSNKGPIPKYPFREMKVGDSFLISDVYSRELMTKYSSSAKHWAKSSKLDRKFSVKKVDEGIRIWRII